MPGIFDIFRSGDSKEREQKDLTEIAYIKSKKEVEHEVFDSLTREFRVDEHSGLRQTATLDQPPTAILRYENQAFSLWYRMPLRGESRTTQIVDYALYRGTHRISPRSNPDFVIECRQLETGRSNRVDPRVVKDAIGLSLDTLPGMVILAVNRELSDIARELAGAYGIQILNMSSETAGREILELVTSDRQTTRERLMRMLETNISKIDSLISKRTATPWGKRLAEERKELLKDRVYKELARGKGNVKQLAKRLHAHEDFVLNELYALEKEGLARTVERSMADVKETIWAALSKQKSSR
ncbi:MAG TPA: hypothetical protein VJB90_01050 [Candidatus Nanoarchaeia archaeon]|uniref:Uncharacterized protein n=1 Tax=Candidatus Naiadarchaeum limnaeum TaxID=2756139 RepID=A0A832V1N2_9ARCH|nr:hypothetical protein [Candidatus Naiadarchaeales archaeon SRR2090153.bin1042]HIK00468.1 hypothetical protein [Candidatus Naiadarchaeum limnaeum]HLD18578.1 hypothetical protein [Candidatus Nanoarchaeia archaeon]